MLEIKKKQLEEMSKTKGYNAVRILHKVEYLTQGEYRKFEVGDSVIGVNSEPETHTFILLPVDFDELLKYFNQLKNSYIINGWTIKIEEWALQKLVVNEDLEIKEIYDTYFNFE